MIAETGDILIRQATSDNTGKHQRQQLDDCTLSIKMSTESSACSTVCTHHTIMGLMNEQINALVYLHCAFYHRTNCMMHCKHPLKESMSK